jgi:hypothetical protein
MSDELYQIADLFLAPARKAERSSKPNAKSAPLKSPAPWKECRRWRIDGGQRHERDLR